MRFFEGVQTTILANGFTVVTDPFPGHVKTAAAIVLAAGNFHDPEGQQGCMHFLEHMFSHSHPEMTQAEFSRDVRRLAISANFSTGRDETQAHAYGRTPSVMHFMDIAGSMFANAGFTAEHVEHERGPIVDEMGNKLSHKSTRDHYANLQSIFGNASRAAMPLGGQPEHLSRIGYEDLRRFRNGIITGANMLFVSAGGLEHADAVAFAQKHFGHLPRGQRLPRYSGPLDMQDVNLPAPERQGLSLDFRLRFDASNLYGAAQPVRGDLAELFLSHLLFETVRLEAGLLYGAHASFMQVNPQQGILAIETSCSPESFKPALHMVRDVLHGVAGYSTRYRGIFEIARETTVNIFAEHAADMAYDMGIRRDRLISGFLEHGKPNDVAAEQAVLAAASYTDICELVAGALRSGPPTVEYRGHSGADLPSGREIGAYLGFMASGSSGLHLRLG